MIALRKKFLPVFIGICWIAASLSYAVAQVPFYIATNATVTLTTNAVVTISTNVSLTIATGGTLQQSGYGQIVLYGNWIHHGIFMPGTGVVLCTGGSQQIFSGSTTLTLYQLEILKEMFGNKVLVDNSLHIFSDFNLARGTVEISNSQAHTVAVDGSITISTNAAFTITTASGVATQHTVVVTSDLRNDGILDFYNSSGTSAILHFVGGGNSSLWGSGSSEIYRVVVEKNSIASIVTITAANFSVPSDGFLQLIRGTFYFGGSTSLTNPFFFEDGYTIPADAQFWLDNPNAAVVGRSGSVTLGGRLRVDQGNYTVGIAGNQDHLLYEDGASFVLNGGTVTITGRFSRGSNTNATITYEQNGGILTVGDGVSSTAPDRALFDIGSSGSTFQWTSGDIVLKRHSNCSDANGGDYFVNTNNGNVAGGRLVVDAAVPGQQFRIHSLLPVGEFLMTGTNNPTARLINVDLQVLGSVTIDGTGASRFSLNGQNLRLGGDLVNNAPDIEALSPGTNAVIFTGSSLQKIRGNAGLHFYDVIVQQQISGDTVRLEVPIRIDRYLRIVSTTVFDITQFDVTIGKEGEIYSDLATGINFSKSKTIFSKYGRLSGWLRREISTSATLPLTLRFPLATPGTYTPAEITFNIGGVVLSTAAVVGVKVVPEEHPEIEASNASLQKYWIVTTSGLTINAGGADVMFQYDPAEAQGNEGSYVVLFYSPAYPQPGAYWRMDPGISADVVDFNLKIFYSQQVDEIDGDWTAGEEQAGRAVYYSRADGDYNDPNTWSRVTFGGPPATRAPNKRSDVVRIRNNTVTIQSPVAEVGKLSVENNGHLVFRSSYVLRGDSAAILPGATLSTEHPEGISVVATTGSIQTDVRLYNSAAAYRFLGSTTGVQTTGDGVPLSARSVIIDADPTDTVKLTDIIQITDSLVINQGIFDLNGYTINGASASRVFRMRDGELIIRADFPTNYAPPTLTAGTVTFNGNGNTTVPASGSTPGVLQYYNLKFTGQRAGTIRLSPEGEIRIANQLLMDGLQFTGLPSKRFITDGSTVVFLKDGDQYIPTRPLSPPDTVTYLQYYNLVVTGNGNKYLSATSPTTFVVLNNLEIHTGSTLYANGHRLEVQGRWVNSGGSFVPGTSQVYFNAPLAVTTIEVLSRDINANPFYTVRIKGDGAVRFVDDAFIGKDLIIETGATLTLTSSSLTLNGDWVDLGGTFNAGQSTVVLSGSTQQTVQVADAKSITFYNLIVTNANGVDATAIGPNSLYGVVVSSTLTLSEGVVNVRNRFLTVLGTVQRPGGNPGHIDGELRKPVPTTASTSVLFEVGYRATYTPVVVTFATAGGTAGLLAVLSDTVTATSTPISTGVNPAGSGLLDSKHLRRQWILSIPMGSSFSLGTRLYDISVSFNGAPQPAGDLRNGADPLFFEARLWDGSQWLKHNRFGNPRQGPRTTNSTVFLRLDRLGAITVGEPEQLSFFSIANGNWSNPSSWSTQDYGGPPTTIEPTTNALIFIGDGKTITLDANKTVDGAVTLDSSGVLLCQDFILAGTGAFSLLTSATLGIGSADGITLSGAAGNIQTALRDYNAGNHNSGHFIYTGGHTQQSGDGLPLTVATLTIMKSVGSSVQLNSNITVRDSLWVNSGVLLANANIDLKGDIRKDGNGDFNPATYTVTFSGSTTQILHSTSGTLKFYNLTISKDIGAGNVVFSSGSSIQVLNTLLFASGNAAIIDVRNEGYVEIATGASVSRVGRGHIYGELRKNIPAGDAPRIDFEVGDEENYVPFSIDFTSGSGSVAGMIGVKNIPGKQPYLDNLYNPPISPIRHLPRYWRVTKPAGSSFQRGNRSMWIRLQFVNPDDLGTVDAPGCLDMAFWKGPSEGWQPLYPNSGAANFSGAGYGCWDSRLTLGAIDYDGSDSTVIVTNVPPDTTFGSTEILPDGSLLLGDFVSGNQNSIAITTFYSRQNGDWTDPNTWSTDSYGGPPASRYPNTQYDIVYIGNGNRVVLDENIGTGILYSDFEENQYFGPAVIVETTGTLSFNTHLLRGVSFTVRKGGTIEIGSDDGITIQGGETGNILTDQRTYEDSCSVVFTGDGYTATFQTFLSRATWHNYCRPWLWNDQTHYITRIRVQNSSSVTIFDNPSGSNFISFPFGHFYFADRSVTMEPGQQYRFILEPSTGGNKRWRVWIDFDRDGIFDDPAERVVDATGNGQYTTPFFAVPPGTLPGVTRMRIMMRDGTGAMGPCDDGLTGQVEDYTVRIVDPNVQVTQQTGDGVPDTLSSFQVRSTRTNPSIVQLQQSLVVIDSFVVERGYFQQGMNNLWLAGDFVNNFQPSGFDQGSGGVTLFAEKQQFIRGTSETSFKTLTIQKTADTVVFATSATIENAMNVNSSTIVKLSNTVILRFGSTATLTSGTVGFSKAKMFVVDGSTHAGVVLKYFNIGSGVTRDFYFPLGVDTTFNPVYASVTADFSNGAYVAVQLRKGKHPNRKNENILGKYWTITVANISNITGNTLRFYYQPQDTADFVAEYIPVRYTNSAGWEINLGPNPKGYPSPIEVQNVTDGILYGDWTAAQPEALYPGRIYYSIADGNWNNPANWSNVSHTGPPASYYPGQIFDRDTVYIDGYQILFNVSASQIDTLAIGGPFNGVTSAGRGELQFIGTPANKRLQLRTLYVHPDGSIGGVSGTNRKDTLRVLENVYNYASTTTGSAIALAPSPADYTVLEFSGTTNSRIVGEGVWNNIAPVIVKKIDGKFDTLIVQSASFSNATGKISSAQWKLTGGIVRHVVTTGSLSLSYGASPVTIGGNSGIDLWSGQIRSSSNIIADVGSTVVIRGGNLTVGDQSNEHFLYKDNVSVTVTAGSVTVAGCFCPYGGNESVQFTLATGAQFTVMRYGHAAANRVGFDLPQVLSNFTMTGGRITIVNGSSASQYDFRVNAGGGSGMIGGTIQSGDSVYTPPGTEIQLSSSIPLTTVHAVGSNVVTQIESQDFTVLKELHIDDNHTFQLRGNTLWLAGNLYNFGVFDVTTGSIGTDQRLVVLNGSTTQVIQNEDTGGITFYNLRLAKPTTSTVVLSTGNSYVIVHGTLEFASGNYGIIDARTNSQYVTVVPGNGGPGLIVRSGQGHVDGRLYRYVGTGPQYVEFPVGTSAIVTGYTPAIIQTEGSGGTAGLIGIITYAEDHPRVTEATIDIAKNVQRYWNVTSASGFFLGGRTYRMTTKFLNPDDLRGGANPLLFVHYLYSPACPDPPTPCPSGTGVWYENTNVIASTATVTSIGNTQFGDFVVGEPSGLSFYSIADGSWTDPNTWSNVGYGGPPAIRFPNQSTDRVYIGDGKTVTIPNTYTPIVRLVRVENVGSGPGALFINGNLGFVRCLDFTLEDSCTLGIQHLNGLSLDPTKGAVQASLKSLGVSRYIFNSTYGSQITGRALPDSIRTLVADNKGTVNKTVFISTYIGVNPLTIVDTLALLNGILNSASRNIKLYGDFVLKNQTQFVHTGAAFLFVGSTTHSLQVDNTSGVDFQTLDLSGGDVVVRSLWPTSATTAQVVVHTNLQFSTSAVINVRDAERKVVITTGATVTRPFGVGHVDGTLKKPVGSGAETVQFEIGYRATALTVTLMLDNTDGNGTAGFIEAIAHHPVPNFPFYNNRMHPTRRVHYYWRLLYADGFSMGSRKANLQFLFPPSELSSITLSKAVIRRKTLSPEIYPWQERRGGDLLWNTTIATVQLAPTSLLWNGLGDFYIGEKYPRTFYSRQSGDWHTSATWSFSGHNGVPVPDGEFPNPDWNYPPEYETEQEDRVIIADQDTVRLTTLPELALLYIGTTGTLRIPDGNYVQESSTTTATVIVGNYGWLDIQSSEGIEQGTTTGILRFTDTQRIFEPYASYKFSGSLDQKTGGAFPGEMLHLVVKNDNAGRRVVIQKSPLLLHGNLDVQTGTLQLQSTDASGIPTNHTITVEGDILIHTSGTVTVESSGPAPRKHLVIVQNDIVVDGQLFLRPIAASDQYVATLMFATSGTQTISGNGAIRLYDAVLNKGDATHAVISMVDIDMSKVNSGDALQFLAGTWEQLSGTLRFDNGVVNSYSQTVPTTGILRITGSGNMQLGLSGSGGSLLLRGGSVVINTTGYVNIGTNANNGVLYTDEGTNSFTLHQGTVTIAGGFTRATNANASMLFTQSGGTLLVAAQGFHSVTTGTFDLGSPLSQFTMSGGALVLRNANAANGPGRPADLFIAATSAIVTGGLVQFGDALTATTQKFTYFVPSAALWDIAVASSFASVYPSTATAALRIQGDLYNDGMWSGSSLRDGSPVSQAPIVFQGSGSSNQSVSGNGITKFHQVWMNRGAGSGVVEFQHDVTISNLLDFQVGSNPNQQIIALGTSANVIIENQSTTAIIDFGSTPYRYIRTSTTSGRVIWNVSANNVYLFPIGSAEGGTDFYTPAKLSVGIGGIDGFVGIRVSRGQRFDGGHLQLPPAATDYLRRYWSIDNVTTTHPGSWTFYYLDGPLHIVGDEANFARVGRWRPAGELPGGSWVGYSPPIDIVANTFSTPLSFPASEWTGDWTLANEDAFRRIFYSRQSGLWNVHTTWTYSPTHTGSDVGVGIYPNAASDSVVVGGGNSGFGDHEVTLNENITIGGVTVGTGFSNTGTLNLQDYVISGNWFVLSTASTLFIGSTSGIMSAPVAAGNIQTAYRIFSTEANYVYNGTSSQVIGTALPTTVATLKIANSGPIGDNTVLIDRNLFVQNALLVTSGVLDLSQFSIANTLGSGQFFLDANATVRIGGSNNFISAFPGFGSYYIDEQSIVEFYGLTKTIDMPPNGGLGYGYLHISDPDIKYINSPLTVRRDVVIKPGAFLWNNVGGDKFVVFGSIVNNGTLCNDGVIEIGQ